MRPSNNTQGKLIGRGRGKGEGKVRDHNSSDDLHNLVHHTGGQQGKWERVCVCITCETYYHESYCVCTTTKIVSKKCYLKLYYVCRECPGRLIGLLYVMA